MYSCVTPKAGLPVIHMPVIHMQVKSENKGDFLLNFLN